MALLTEAVDAHFAWMLGESPVRRSPAPAIRRSRCAVRAQMDPPNPGGHGTRHKLDDGRRRRGGRPLRPEVAGEADGFIEIGYGVKPDHRRRGYAKRAAAEMIERARLMAGIHGLWATTAADNEPSQRVLMANGFVDCGGAVHPQEGELVLWRLALS